MPHLFNPKVSENTLGTNNQSPISLKGGKEKVRKPKGRKIRYLKPLPSVSYNHRVKLLCTDETVG